jgi:hypothetical protein
MIAATLLLGWGFGFSSAVPGEPKVQPRKLVARAIRAHGGAELLGKPRPLYVKTRGTVQIGGSPNAYLAETHSDWPTRFRNQLTIDNAGMPQTLTQILEGDRVSMLVNGRKVATNERTTADLKELAYAQRVQSLVPLLEDRSFTLEAAGRADVEGRPTDGVLVRSENHREVVLFFDRESSLLVRVARQTLDPATGKGVSQVEFYSDFRLVGGVRRPAKVTVFRDGKKYLEGESVEMKYLDRLDDALFADP